MGSEKSTGYRSCPACSGTDISVKYKRVYGTKSLLRCERCGLAFIWPKSPCATDDHLYSKNYYESWSLAELGVEGVASMKRATFDSLLDIIAEYKKSGKLLDVGCAFGHLLEVACRKGWKCWGVEVSEYAAKLAANAPGIEKVWTGDFLKLSISCEKFDAIIMVDFIEHACDIKALLDKCKGMLNHNGLMIIVTPDFGSISHKCLKKYWPHFNNEHVSYFSKDCIKNLLPMMGFDLLRISNFKKTFNICYLESQVCAHCNRLFVFIARIFGSLIPKRIKRSNFLMSHGEMLIIARKRSIRP